LTEVDVKIVVSLTSRTLGPGLSKTEGSAWLDPLLGEGTIMSKDKGRKEIKKPKQPKVKAYYAV